VDEKPVEGDRRSFHPRGYQGITVDVEGPTPEVKDPGGNIRRGATGTLKINRKDFGIAWNKVLDSGGLVVGDEVNISVEVEMVRK